jgi:hypothetical protein
MPYSLKASSFIFAGFSSYFSAYFGYASSLTDLVSYEFGEYHYAIVERVHIKL